MNSTDRQAEVVNLELDKGAKFLGVLDEASGPVVVLRSNMSRHASIKEVFTDGSTYVPLDADAATWTMRRR